MMTKRCTLFAVFVCVTILQASDETRAQSLPGAYRGMFVCEKVPGSADILHVPVDLVIHGDTVQSWRDPEGDAHSRTCEVALVPAPHAKHADSQQ